MRFRLCLVAASLAVTACDEARPPGRCGTYVDTPGTARIVSVEAAPAGQANCANTPTRVLFDFTPTDPAASALAASAVPLTVGAGYNPPNAWVVSSSLTVGSDHPAVRSDQAVGPCTPVVFELTDVDLAAGLAACF